MVLLLKNVEQIDFACVSKGLHVSVELYCFIRILTKMKSIYDDLLRGNAREKLSVVSDLLSITGFSLGAAIAPVLAIRNTTKVSWSSAVGIFSCALLFFAGLAMLLVWIMSINRDLSKGFDDSFSSKLIKASLLSISAYVYLMAIAAVATFFSTVQW